MALSLTEEHHRTTQQCWERRGEGSANLRSGSDELKAPLIGAKERTWVVLEVREVTASPRAHSRPGTVPKRVFRMSAERT